MEYEATLSHMIAIVCVCTLLAEVSPSMKTQKKIQNKKPKRVPLPSLELITSVMEI